MKVIGLIPYWMDYQSQNGVSSHKNLKKLGGQYLINYSLRVLNSTKDIDQVLIYASDERVLDITDDSIDFDYMKRPKFLDANDIAIENIIEEFLKVSDADIIVMLHPNSPFLRSSTVHECVEKVISGDFDSAFTAYEYKKLTWFKGRPLNYSLDMPTPQLKKLDPVIFEQSSLYVFTRDSYFKQRKRVGVNPYIKIIDHFEGHEVNVAEDFQIAELIVNSGMYSEF